MLYLAASNPDPRPSLNEMIGASGCSADTDQTTADGWSVTYAIGFGAGAIVTAAAAWVISWFL